MSIFVNAKIVLDENKKMGTKDIVDILLENLNQNRFAILMVDRFYLDIGGEKTMNIN